VSAGLFLFGYFDLWQKKTPALLAQVGVFLTGKLGLV